MLCITRVTRESHAPSHSHAIWTKSRVGGAFGFGWHYLELKYNFDRPFLFPNSTLFQTQILFRRNTTLAGISRYQLVPEQALNYNTSSSGSRCRLSQSCCQAPSLLVSTSAPNILSSCPRINPRTNPGTFTGSNSGHYIAGLHCGNQNL